MATSEEAKLGLVEPGRRRFDLTHPLPGRHDVVVPAPPPRRGVMLIIRCARSAQPDVRASMLQEEGEPTGNERPKQAPWDDSESWPLDAKVSWKLYRGDQLIADGSCEPTADGGYRSDSTLPGDSSIDFCPQPLIALPLWQVPLRIELSAPGYAPRTLELDAEGIDELRVVTLTAR